MLKARIQLTLRIINAPQYFNADVPTRQHEMPASSRTLVTSSTSRVPWPPQLACVWLWVPSNVECLILVVWSRSRVKSVTQGINLYHLDRSSLFWPPCYSSTMLLRCRVACGQERVVPLEVRKVTCYCGARSFCWNLWCSVRCTAVACILDVI